MIELGANKECQDNNGHTPLHHACLKEHKEIALQLIKAGAAIECKDNNGRTPLHFASSLGVEKLIELGANKECQDNNGHTPLHYASSEGRQDVVAKLIELGANIECKDTNGRTPLHHACSKGKINVVLKLIEKGANVNSLDLNGNSSLGLACSKNDNIADRVTIIEELISKEACVNGTSKMTRVEKDQFLKIESRFFSPLGFAMSSNSQELIDALISKGAKEKYQIIQARDEASTGFIPPNQYQGERPSTSITSIYAFKLLRYIYNLSPR